MIVLFEGLCGVAVTVGWCDVLLKHHCFTAGHHFDEYRKLNIKNPLFNANGGFFVLGEFVGEGACPSRNITAIIKNKLIKL